LKADVRAFTNDELNRVEQAATKLAASPSIDGITIKTGTGEGASAAFGLNRA